MMEQYSKLKQQAKALQGILAALKGLQKRAARQQCTTSLQIKEAFEAVMLALDGRDEAAHRGLEVEKTLSAQKLKALDSDCRVLLRYLQVKKQQLMQLRILGTHSSVLALNAFADIAPTIEAMEQQTDSLLGAFSHTHTPHPFAAAPAAAAAAGLPHVAVLLLLCGSKWQCCYAFAAAAAAAAAADMRERLQVPHWRLRVLEVEGLLEDRQDALEAFSGRVGQYCERASAAVESFTRLVLPLDASPAEHKEAEPLEEYAEIETERFPPIIYPKGLDPYSRRFLQLRKPAIRSGFRVSDQLHPQWEIRMVSLRGPYLCVHESEDDPHSRLESAWLLGRNTFARTFADPGLTALGALAKADYPHGLEVVAVDLKAKELQRFLLLAADGQRLAAEWAEAIELLCFEEAGGSQPEAPAHDPRLALDDLKLEAAGLPFPLPHRRKASQLPADLLGTESEEERESSFSSSETEDGLSSSSGSPGSSEDEARAGLAADSDSDHAAEEALAGVAAPLRPTIKVEETAHWERDAKSGRRHRRPELEAGQRSHIGVAGYKVPDGSSNKEKNNAPSTKNDDPNNKASSSRRNRGGRSRGNSQEEGGDNQPAAEQAVQERRLSQGMRRREGGGHVTEMVEQIEAKVAGGSLPVASGSHKVAGGGPSLGVHDAGERERRTSKETVPHMGTLEYAQVVERQEPSVRKQDAASSNNSKEGRPSSGPDWGKELAAARQFKDEPRHGDPPPTARGGQQAAGSVSSPKALAAPAAAAAAAGAAAAKGAMPKRLLLGSVSHEAVSSQDQLESQGSAGPLVKQPAAGPLSPSLSPRSSPPLRLRFSYTAGMETPSQRRRQRASQGEDPATALDFIKLKMPPRKALPIFNFSSSRDATPRPQSPAAAAPPAAAVAVAADSAAAGKANVASSTRIRRATPSEGGSGATAAAAATAAASAAPARRQRRLFSTPAMPPPVGAARLVPRRRHLETGGSGDLELVQRVLHQIGSLKISGSGAAAAGELDSSSGPDSEAADGDSR
ncbi:hypothetical protein Efla_003506 [Eimeria flavescens]